MHTPLEKATELLKPFDLLDDVELHDVLARDDADDAVVHVRHHQVAQPERAEQLVRAQQRVVLVHLGR